MNRQIMVSISCLVYNHEKYIRQCLEGLLMQKTDFAFEVLIHDDASSDASAQIIREYEAKFPDIVKPIYQKENQYSKGVQIDYEYQFSRAKGKYIALCEGDDFWTDPYKLQKQFNALETNKQCRLCVGKTTTVYENGSKATLIYPGFSVESEIIPQNTFLKMAFKYTNFHTSNYFFRAQDIMHFCKEKPEFVSQSPIGDQIILLYYGSLGDVYYINEFLSTYRLASKEGWSDTHRKMSKEGKTEYQEKMIKVYRLFNDYTNKAHENIIREGIARREFEIMRIKYDYRGQLSKEVRRIFLEQSKLYRLKVYSAVLCPPVAKMIQRTREKHRLQRHD